MGVRQEAQQIHWAQCNQVLLPAVGCCDGATLSALTWVLLADLGDQEGAHAGASAATQGVAHLEACTGHRCRWHQVTYTAWIGQGRQPQHTTSPGVAHEVLCQTRCTSQALQHPDGIMY